MMVRGRLLDRVRKVSTRAKPPLERTGTRDHKVGAERANFLHWEQTHVTTFQCSEYGSSSEGERGVSCKTWKILRRTALGSRLIGRVAFSM
jgi:hypothetical protein